MEDAAECQKRRRPHLPGLHTCEDVKECMRSDDAAVGVPIPRRQFLLRRTRSI